MAATSADIIAAAADADLRARAIALAAASGIDYPQGFVEANSHRLAAAPVNEAGDTVASVYAYASASYEPTPRPGENLAAVTDDHIRYALSQVAPNTTPTA